MTDCELQKLIKEDAPTEINVEFDSKTILKNCKEKKERNKKLKTGLIVVSSSVLISLITILNFAFFRFIPLNNVNHSDKIYVEKFYATDEEIIVDSPDHKYVFRYGVDIILYCDYSKHKDYNKWAKEFVYEYNTENVDESHSYLFNDYLNNIYYDLIKNNFTNATSHFLMTGSQCICINYVASTNDYETVKSAVDNMKEFVRQFYSLKDYENIKKLCSEDFITKVVIAEQWPDYGGEE